MENDSFVRVSVAGYPMDIQKTTLESLKNDSKLPAVDLSYSDAQLQWENNSHPVLRREGVDTDMLACPFGPIPMKTYCDALAEMKKMNELALFWEEKTETILNTLELQLAGLRNAPVPEDCVSKWLSQVDSVILTVGRLREKCGYAKLTKDSLTETF